jgi:hypothetical protein
MIDRLCAYANLSLFANVSAICDATGQVDVLMFKRVGQEKACEIPANLAWGAAAENT